MTSALTFFSEQTSFQLDNTDVIRKWLVTATHKERFSITGINIIFCSDVYLHSLNKKYLKHDTYTDIITFAHSQDELKLEGDIFISIDRAKENATHYKVTLENEIARLMIHGLLHLMGYSDKTEDQKLEMRKKEEAYLSLLKSNFT